METYIALLRGINLGAHKKVAMPALKSLFESLGLQSVQTYIQSGNVVFQGPQTGLPLLTERLESAIAGHFGFEVPVILRTQAAWARSVENNPFLRESAAEPAFLHVTLLDKTPDGGLVDRLDTSRYEPDRFILSGTEIYLYCPQGYGQTKLHNTFLENKLKVRATTRNWKTMLQLMVLSNG